MQTEILELTPGNRLDTFSTATVVVEAINETDEAIVVDHDQTRVFLELRSLDDELLLVIDEALRQRMLFERKLRESPEPQTVRPAQQERFVFDLANYYYPFAEGEYRLIPCFQSPDEGRLAGAAIDLQVVAQEATQIREWYENPIFGTHSLLSRIMAGAYLRWLGLNQPLASFFNKPLEVPQPGYEAIPSVAAFFDLEDFAPGFEKVIVWHGSDSEIFIAKYEAGDLVGQVTSVHLPDSSPLLPYSFRTEDGRVFVFTIGGTLRGYEIDPVGNVTFRLGHSVHGRAETVAVSGGPDIIHVVTMEPALTHAMFDYQGGLVQTTDIGRGLGDPLYLSTDLASDYIKAVYVDPYDARIVNCVQSTFPSIEEPAVEPQTAKLTLVFETDERLSEIDLLFDRFQRLYVLYSTDNGRLLYHDPSGETHHVASEETKYFPRLLPGDMETALPFVGFFMKSRGYRFYPTGGMEPWRDIRAMRV